MQNIANARGDPMSRFHNALYAGDVEGRIEVLRDVGMYPLAYLTAKTNGLDELAAEILEAAGLTEADVDDVPTFGVSTLKPPPVVTSTTNINLGHQSPRAKTSLTRPLQTGTSRVVTMSPTSMVSIPPVQLRLLL